jgi:predicted DNA binding protein
MPLFDVVVRVTHDSPFIDFSRKFPSAKLFYWCNSENDVLEIMVGNPDDYALVKKHIPKVEGILEESTDHTKMHLIIHKCACTIYNSLDCCIGDLNLLHVYPEIIEKGWEYHRIIAFRHDDLETLLHRVEAAGWITDIVRKAPFDGFIASSLMLTADALFADLTPKQMNAVLTAYGQGYYTLPRKADVQTIAATTHVARTTFQEHLKKGENKLVASLVPYMKLFAYTPEERRIPIN